MDPADRRRRHPIDHTPRLVGDRRRRHRTGTHALLARVRRCVRAHRLEVRGPAHAHRVHRLVALAARDRRRPADLIQLLRGIQLSCQAGAEHGSGGRQAKGPWEHACPYVVAPEQAGGRVDAVYDGGRFEPTAHGRTAVQGDEQPESQAEVTGADHSSEEARPALRPATAGDRAAHQARRQKRHDADPDPSARQADRQLSSLHPADATRGRRPVTTPRYSRGMLDPDRRRRSSSGRILDALLWGAALGAASGAVLGGAIDGVGAGLGAVIGAALYAPAEVITSIRRGAAEPKPLWHRILSRTLLMGLFGWVLGLIYGSDEPLLTGIISGALVGLLGLRPVKAALGLLIGAAVGALFQTLDSSIEPALIAAVVTLAYRVVAAIAYRGRQLVRVMAEEVPASELRYVVPFEARSRYVGADYVEQLAKIRGGTFRRNPPDVGILASLAGLDGPGFDAGRVHPLIREFYEHTSRFRLSIVPEWRQWMKPGYEIFKRLVAQPLGQAAIPSNIEEAQRGMVSTIDTIALHGNEEIDIRGWIRTYADSGKPIYVGIYTSFRHEDRGYVSVGFPIPSANFTATLLPRNVGEHDFLLTSRSDLAFPGHYLSSVDSERGALTVLKLLYFQEQIFVYIADGDLRTDHSFYLAGQRFLTLHYEIERLAATRASAAGAGR